MRNNTSQTLPQLPVVVGFTALAFLMFVPDVAQAQELFACYVPSSGVVYRIKEPRLRDECTGREHVEFSWAGLAVDNGDVTLTVDGTVAASAFASASPLIFEAPAGTERMRIDETNGNVGIGTTSPTARLNIVADGAALRVNRASAPGADVLSLQADPAGGRISVNDQSGSAKVAILAAGNSFFNGGNVGIGTTSPSEKLEVKDGNIRVTNGSFIDDGMTLNVPDYVFEEGYPLMSLDELREYIAGEKHLPNVPSAEDIERDGLNLSQFQMKLLEKIEELTLYILAQQEQIEALRVRVQE